MRVLHLIDPSSPGSGPCTLKLLADAVRLLDSIDHVVLILGAARDVALARRCGVGPIGHVCPLRREPSQAKSLLRRYALAAARAGARVDLVHVWNDAVAVLRDPLLWSTASGAWPQAHATLLATSEPVATACRDGRVSSDVAALSLAVNVDEPALKSRAQVRQSWAKRFGESIDDLFVVGLLGENVELIDARRAATIIARLALAGRPIRLLLHRQTGRALEATRFCGRLGLAHVMIFDDDVAEPWRVVAGLDAALCLSRDFASARPPSLAAHLARIPNCRECGPAQLPMLWSMAAGVPVVADGMGHVREIIADDSTGFFIAPKAVDAASDRLARLHDDVLLRSRMNQAAREYVRRYRALDEFSRSLFNAYLQFDRSAAASTPKSG